MCSGNYTHLVMPKSNVKPKAVVTEPKPETGGGNAKRKATSTAVSNEELNLDNSVGLIVTNNIEIEVDSPNEPDSTRSNKRIRYTEPTLEKLETVRGNVRMQSTHKATE
ncbi:13693_t:CDS:2, partial [Racocetra persica]